MPTSSGASLKQLSWDDPRWDALLAVHPDRSVFHSNAWIRLLSECYGYKRRLLALVDGPELLAAVPVLDVRSLRGHIRHVSLPFSDHVPILATTKDAANNFVRHLDVWRGARPVVIHAGVAGSTGIDAGYLHSSWLQTDHDRMFAGFHRTRVRQPLARAVADSGMKIRDAHGRHDLAAFSHLLARTRRRHGVPPQPSQFLYGVYEQFISRGSGRLLLAERDGRLIAGSIFLYCNGVIHYKYNASDPLYWSAHPNHAILWRAMVDAANAGIERFDWGRTDSNDTGLRSFKLGWGSHEEQLCYTVLGDYRIAQHARWKQQILRHAPLWAGRIAGRLLYRFHG